MSPAPIPVDRASVEALGWALLHFVWQGAVVAALLAGADGLMSRARAHARYLTACAALLAMLALPIATFVTQRGSVGAAEMARAAAREQTAAATASGAFRARQLRAPARTPSASHGVVARAGVARVAPAPHLLAPGRVLPRDLARRLSAVLPWGVAAWALGVAVLSLRLLGGWWLVARLRHSVSNLPLDAWQEALERLARRVGVSRPVHVLRSVLVDVPTAIGWLRPVILIPASTLAGLAPAQIEAILAHELAHIRRHDYLVNLLQSVIETLLFYHPAVWWVSRRIRDERELCCDEIAVRVSGDAVGYARALCELERLRQGAPALAMAASGGSLRARIARLLGVRPRRHDEGARGFAVAFGAALLVALVALGSLDVPLGGASGSLVPSKRTIRSHPPKPPVAVERPLEADDEAIAAPPAESLAPAAEAAAAAEFAGPVAPFQETVAAARQLAPVIVRELLPAIARALAVVPAVLPQAVAPVVPAEPAGCKEHEAEEVEASEAWASIPSGRFTITEWIELSKHGIDGEHIAAYAEAGLPNLTATELVTLTNHGVSPEYVLEIRQAGLAQVTPEDLVQLASHGVSPDYVARLRTFDPHDLAVPELVRLANAGVSPEWFAAMRWMGYGDLDAEEAIRLAHAGVSVEVVSQLRILLHRPPSLEQVRALQAQGVSVEYLAEFAGLLPTDVTPEDLVQLSQAGVQPEFVRTFRALGYRDLAASDLVSLAHAGVTVELVAALEGAGYGRFPAGELVQLTHRGVTAEHVANIRALGIASPSASDLVRLVESGAASPPVKRRSR
jgi:beta-lactamase regulating signal transducer with metallopeptidase domain